MQEWTTSDPTNFDRYERIAPFYDLLDLPFEYALYRRIRVMLFDDLSGCLLDAGVGTGRNIPFYPPGSHVVGIDFSPAIGARVQSTLIAFKGATETGRSVGDTDRSSLAALLNRAL